MQPYRFAPRQLTLVAYDIAHNKRRRAVARLLEGSGQRVQDSVFHCWLRPPDLAQLVRELSEVINPAEDTVRLYPICNADAPDIQFAGVKKPESPIQKGFEIV
jgi:CRISPR-associated protein Cas2